MATWLNFSRGGDLTAAVSTAASIPCSRIKGQVKRLFNCVLMIRDPVEVPWGRKSPELTFLDREGDC